MLNIPGPRPARSYDEARERAEDFAALDDGSIRPEARTTLLDFGKRSRLAVVLLHGFTNHPGQYVEFAPDVHEGLSANVFIPRLPEHGDYNRMTTRLKSLTAEQYLTSAQEALDIACGLGERVCILGISTSALLCAYFAQYRPEVARAIPVSPVFSMLKLPYGVNRLAARIASALPNAFVWWDPRNKEKELPATGYPRFPTHALMQTLRIADDVYARAAKSPVAARSIVAVTNKRDPAVNNHVTDDVVKRWQTHHNPGTHVESFEFINLPENHDIIDPQNAEPRLDIVYPKLLDLISTTPTL